MTSTTLKLAPLITRFTLRPSLRSQVCHVQLRNSNFDSSKYLADIAEISTKYEVSRNPEEWKYVERVLPKSIVPEPLEKPEYPSGWKPAAKNLEERPYCVERTKNHMIPVYLEIKQRGVVRHTVIRRIKGDIWLLEKELRPFLEDLIKPKPLRLQVDEFSGKICINGDHVNAIKYWLQERDF